MAKIWKAKIKSPILTNWGSKATRFGVMNGNKAGVIVQKNIFAP